MFFTDAFAVAREVLTCPGDVGATGTVKVPTGESTQSLQSKMDAVCAETDLLKTGLEQINV